MSSDDEQPPFEIPSVSIPPKRPPEPLTEQKVDFALTIFWTKITQTWDEAKCQLLLTRVSNFIASSEFDRNFFERKFQIEGLDDLAHSGASLLALQKVLQARVKG